MLPPGPLMIGELFKSGGEGVQKNAMHAGGGRQALVVMLEGGH